MNEMRKHSPWRLAAAFLLALITWATVILLCECKKQPTIYDPYDLRPNNCGKRLE